MNSSSHHVRACALTRHVVPELAVAGVAGTHVKLVRCTSSRGRLCLVLEIPCAITERQPRDKKWNPRSESGMPLMTSGGISSGVTVANDVNGSRSGLVRYWRKVPAARSSQVSVYLLNGAGESSGVRVMRVRKREHARACPSISLEFNVCRRRPAINAHLLQVRLDRTHDEFVRQTATVLLPGSFLAQLLHVALGLVDKLQPQTQASAQSKSSNQAILG